MIYRKPKRVRNVDQLRQQMDASTRFLAEAALFGAVQSEQLIAAIEKLARAINHRGLKQPKRPPSRYQCFFGEAIKAGKTPAQAGAEWRARAQRKDETDR